MLSKLDRLARALLWYSSGSMPEEDDMRPKCIWTAVAAITAGLLLWGCEVTKTVYVTAPDTTAPGVPRGVSSITGDREVTIVWLGSTEDDLKGYVVYRDDNRDGSFDELADIVVTEYRSQWTFIDRNVSNSRTYDYAVTAYDYDGNESDLSYEDVFDTPRPAGYNVYVDALSDQSGWNFLRRMKVSRGSPDADIIFTYDPDLETLFIEAAFADDDVQDFGYTESLDDLDWAPQNGWSSVGWCELILGHTYVIWTDANRYAKVRVIDIGETWLRFDWAHQEDLGNPELKRGVPDSLIAQNP